MQRRKGSLGERIVNLEQAYRSQGLTQKDLAKALGVSDRTIRRMKHRTDPVIPKRLKVQESILSSKEDYRYRRKWAGREKLVPPAIEREVNISTFLGGGGFFPGAAMADLGANMNTDYPEATRQILENRPDLIINVMVDSETGQVIRIPNSDETGAGSAQHLKRAGFELQTYYIPGDSYDDWDSLSSAIWKVFNKAYKKKKK